MLYKDKEKICKCFQRILRGDVEPFLFQNPKALKVETKQNLCGICELVHLFV